MASIYFHTEDIQLNIINKKTIRETIIGAASSMNKKIGQINYIFCTDDYLDQINQKYLNHFDLTDIITFNTSDDERISGDIFISVERVKENANIFQTQIDAEMLRVVFHGILHLLGYNDKTENDVKEMRSMEDVLIQTFKNNVTRETFYV